MIQSQLTQVRLHLVRRAEAVHDTGEGMEKAVALRIHGGREHWTQFGIRGEQTTIEIGHCMVARLRHERKCMGYCLGTRYNWRLRFADHVIQLARVRIAAADTVITYQDRHAGKFATCTP